MKLERDPRRLLHPRSGTPDAVRRALDAGRGEAPGADRLARMAARLPVGGPSGGGGPGSGPGAVPTKIAQVATTTAAPLWPSILVGAVLGGVVGAGLPFGQAVSTSAGPPLPPRASSEIVAAPLPGPAAPPPSAEAKVPEYDPPRQGPSRSAAIVAPAPRAPLDEPASAQAAGAEAVSAQASSPPPEESESALVRRAQSALGANPGEALSLANRHLARFPGGMFAQEREVIAITALRSLGRTAEAEARAAAFLGANPRSAYRPRVESLAPNAGGEK